jgi:three-Cys-motif partner protein
MQEFGSVWTESKLGAIEKYLNFYTAALKKFQFRLCYIDAFAGSGSIKLKNGEQIEGSAVRALKYPFDKFYFLDKNKVALEALKQKIDVVQYQNKDIEFHATDCNDFLSQIGKIDWAKANWRGVIFLDPFAMELNWECLNKISGTKIFDVWYLFPFGAFNRNLYKNGKMPEANKKRIDFILGTNDWPKTLYSISPQRNFFEDVLLKDSVENIKNYLLTRLKQTFPTVSDNALILRNDRNAPIFLLCFAGSNPTPKAKMLSLKAADYILTHI